MDDDGAELRDPAKVRARTGYAGHTPLVWDELTVRENLELQLRLRNRSTDHAAASIERFGLQSRAEDRADTLSRGLRQRLALACATSHRPRFLLLDEPASNLDEAALATLRAVLAELRGHSTIVLATHEPQLLRGLADRVLRVSAGRIDGGAA